MPVYPGALPGTVSPRTDFNLCFRTGDRRSTCGLIFWTRLTPTRSLNRVAICIRELMTYACPFRYTIPSKSSTGSSSCWKNRTRTRVSTPAGGRKGARHPFPSGRASRFPALRLLHTFGSIGPSFLPKTQRQSGQLARHSDSQDGRIDSPLRAGLVLRTRLVNPCFPRSDSRCSPSSCRTTCDLK